MQARGQRLDVGDQGGVERGGPIEGTGKSFPGLAIFWSVGENREARRNGREAGNAGRVTEERPSVHVGT